MDNSAITKLTSAPHEFVLRVCLCFGLIFFLFSSGKISAILYSNIYLAYGGICKSPILVAAGFSLRL
jgi:hypothetical protein